MRRKHTEQRLGITLAVAIIVVALLGVIGWATWQNSSVKKYTAKQEGSSQQPVREEKKDDTEGYLVIEEWGIKIKMRDPEKVEVVVNNTPGRLSWLDYDFDGSLNIPIKSQYAPGYQCEGNSIGAGLFRSKAAPAYADSLTSTKIGDYYYVITGGPGVCSDVQEEADLQTRLLQDFRLENIEPLS